MKVASATKAAISQGLAPAPLAAAEVPAPRADRAISAKCRYAGISVRLNRFAEGLGCGVYAAETTMPSCSQELATSDTVARCMSRFQRRSSKSEPRCIVQRLSQITRSWTRQRCV
jgi:hypothetical protein